MTIRRRQHQAPYEESDIKVSGVALFTVILVLSCGLLMGVMAWLYGQFQVREREAAETLAPATRVPRTAPQHPPEPVIQGAPGSRFELQDPVLEMEDHRARMEQALTTSDWVDRNAQTVRIPIEHAKKLLLERGLPVREERTDDGGVP